MSRGRGEQDASSTSTDAPLGQSFTAALAAVETNPASVESWDHLEELADTLDRPDEVGAAYRAVLDADVPRDVWSTLAERAARFHEEWFGDSPDEMLAVLRTVIEKDPSAQWAFERLTMVLTTAERWDDLLDQYDHALQHTRDPAARKRLLDDAAHTAKDFAKKPGRAVDYMQLQLELDAGNEKLAKNIERLLERQNRWEDLIELWQNRLPELAPPQARIVRLKVARTFLDHLEAAADALPELRALVEESPGHPEACAELEKLLRKDAFSEATRLEALGLLRTNYRVSNRPEAIVDALLVALQFADETQRVALRRETASRLAILGRDADALAHYGDLLREEPSDADARRQLRELALRSDLHTAHVEALVAAAEQGDTAQSAALLMEAAAVAKTRCEDTERAIALFSRVVELDDGDPTISLSAAHQLNELLATAGRTAERLDVLERLATLESAPVVRRAVLGEVGQLADELGDPDRALAAFGARREADPSDTEALDATIALLEKHQRWAPLCEALSKRATSTPVHQQRRADLIRLARVQETELEAIGDAIDTWLQVREEFGDEAETVGALDSLMATAMRFGELADILDDAAATRRLGAAKLLSRLGEVHREQLGNPGDAAQFLAQSLAVEARESTARKGLAALLDDDATDPTVCAATANALARAYRDTGEWQALLELVDARVAAAPDPFAAVEVLREAARLHEQQAGEPRAALDAIARALVADPDSVALEAELLRLAEVSEDWARAVSGLEEAGGLASSPARAAALFRREAQLRQNHLEDAPGAVEALGRAAEQQPDDLPIQRAIIEASARAGTWTAAAAAAMGICRARELLDEDVLNGLAQAADVTDGWEPLLAALDEALADVSGLPTAVARDLYAQVARWHLDQRDDLAAAETSARNALGFAAGHRPTLEFLAELQRRVPEAAQGDEPPLCHTLVEIDGLSDRDLDPLTEAAEVAEAAPAGDAFRRTLLARLYRKSARLLAAAEAIGGSRDPKTVVTWALEQLVALDVAGERHADAIKALVAAAQMPLPREAVNQLRLRAAALCSEHGEQRRAIELFRQVLDEQPDDLALVTDLAALCEAEGRTLAVLELRNRELELTEDPARKLALRLQLSTLVGAVEEKSGRVQSLQANLAELPGHPETIAAVTRVLGDRGRYEDLATTLAGQAETLEGLDQGARAAELWTDLAHLVQDEFGDVDRAIDALTRVVELAPSSEAYDHLARLHLHRDEPAVAATVLRRRLEETDPSNRVPILLRLARAQILADASGDAAKTLQSAFDDAPSSVEVRKLLIKLNRDLERWEPLARTLTVASEHVSDPDTLLAYAREASEIYSDRLGTPGDAVPVLERAHAKFPDDRDLRARLAAGQRVAGRLDDARTMLETLIGAFGRRRSAQRAAAHLELARVAQAQGDMETATDQLELASGMDANNPAILQTLAEAARDAGQLERAERAYRTLLIQARRRPVAADDAPRSDGDGRIGATEVLFELSCLAQARGDGDQAHELIESAMEALAEREGEGEHLAQRLRDRDEHALLQRVLEARLAQADTARARAKVLGELADLQAAHLDDPAAALASRLQALRADPLDGDNHEKARGLAVATGDVEAYVGAVETMLDKARRTTDVYVRCELLLRLAEASQVDRNDTDAASQLLETAEGLGVREVDVWRAAARIAGARGDTATQMAYLEKLAELGADTTETRADALYRMAEVHLASDDVDDGIRVLEEALEMTPRSERACRILARATTTADTPPALLALYERVARATGDQATLLTALERVAQHPDTSPEDVREAVDLAETLGEPERAEALMMRAIELASGTLEGVGRVSWALVSLAHRRRASGDTAGAVKWLCEAIESGADLPPLVELAETIAAEGREAGDLSFALVVYEALHQRDTTSAALWKPLADLYRELGDLDKLARLVEDTVDTVTDPQERNALRLELAKTLLSDGTRIDDATEVLRNLLMEEPDHAEANALLMDALERGGRDEDVIELLRERLMNAQGAGDAEAVVAAARSLAARQQSAGADTDARETLSSALDWAPEDTDLLREVLDMIGEDAGETDRRTDLLRRLLAQQQGDEAAQTAMTLASIAEAQGDEDARLQALVDGYGRAPGHDELRSSLEQAYEASGDYRGLSALVVKSAEEAEDPADAATLYRQAATIHRELLMDAEGSADLLARAKAANPDDPSLAIDLASTLAGSGQLEQAITALSELLDGGAIDAGTRHQLQGTRADLRLQTGDIHGAVQDLEAAYAADPADLAPRLIDALERLLSQAAGASDAALERSTTLRLSELAMQTGDQARAQELLTAWVERERKDAEALRLLRDLATQRESWAMAAKLNARLVAVETGDAQADAALRLADACAKVGKAAEARPGLEHARRKQPDNRAIRDRLRDLYEEMGAEKELTKILALEAAEVEDPAERIPLLRRVADLSLAHGEHEAGMDAITQILSIAPGDPGASVLLADAYLAVGDVDQAEAVILAALDTLKGKRGAEVAVLYHRQARVAGGRGDAPGQLELLQQAFAADKNNGEIAAELADLAEVLESWDVATRVLRTITLLDGPCPISRVQAFLRQAQICLHRGDRQRAVLWARKAKHEGPDDPDVDQFLAQLEG
ncbi:MAG: tetratricopeptide repeat protein [Myxococcota bacterium]